MWTKRIGIVALLAGAFLAGETSPAADNRSAPVSVSANVVPGCRLTSSNLDFGAYDPLGAHELMPLDGLASIEVTCTRGISAVLRLDAAGALFLDEPGGAALSYGLYEDAARAEPFTAMALSGELRQKEIPVYGRVGPGQVVPSGVYTDAVVFQVDF